MGEGEFEDAIDQWYANLSTEEKIEEFGTIIYINHDDNCGYYHIVLYLLKRRNKISSDIPIAEFLRALYRYVIDNTDIVIEALDYVTRFRGCNDRE